MLIRSALGAADKRRIQAMLFANNGGDLRQQLLDGAPFLAELTHSLIPTRGSLTPTFTRASTATFRDWEGVLRTVPSGCARFEGARMVSNLLTFTEDFSNAAWTKENVVVAADQTVAPDGTTTADKLTPSGAVAFADILNSVTVAAGRTVVLSVYAKKATSDFIFLRLTMADFAPYTYFNLNTGAVGTTGAGITATITSLDDGWYRCAVRGVVSAAPPADRVDIGVSSVDGALGATASDSIYIWHPQLEDVTGQADQTASEYVSVGVESAPYHGAGVDGVEFFNTDRDGAVIPAATNTGYLAEGARTNLCLQSNAFTTTWVAAGGTPTATQSAVGPDGATSAWTVTDNDPANNEAFSTPNILLTAASYTYSMFVKKTTGAQTAYPCLWFLNAAVTAILPCTIDTTNGTATVWTAYTGLAVMAGGSARCTSYNADYWRVELTGTGTAANWTVRFGPALTTNPTQSTGIFDVAAQGSHVFYGAQVELGSFATPYIPTTTVAVARNADVDQYPTTDGPIAAAGSIALDFTPYHAPSGTIALWGTYVDASNYTAILHDATNLIFRKRIAGSNYDATIANAFVSGTTYKMAASWGAGGSTIHLNGVAGTPHANTTAAQIAATMQVGADGNSLQQPGAAVIKNYIWQRQLSGSEQAAITA